MAYTNLLGQVRVGVRGAQVVTQSLLLDGMSGLMGAYSLRKLIGTWTGGAILVRRSLDNAESSIGFDAVGDLDQSALTSFVRPTITGYVLDQYSGSSVGLSLRKISGSYSGSAIRVRRSGDNAEQNIGFSGDNLDTASLLSFVGYNNIALYSEEFDNANWNKYITTVTSNQAIAPDGTMTADLLSEASANNYHTLSNGINLPFAVGTSWNVSLYIKKGPGTSAPNTIILGFPSSGTSTFPHPCVLFDISSGVVLDSLNASNDSNFGSSIVDAGNGWWRCSVWGTVTVAGNRLQHGVIRFNNNLNTISGTAYAGNSQTNIYMWGWQFQKALNDTSVLTTQPYTKTTATAGGNGFVTTWYDQSGNGLNATQITAGSQPQIVSNGSILLQGGKPSIKYDGSNDYMTISTFTASVKTIFALFQHNGVDSYDGIVTARPTGEVNLGLASDERSGFTMAYSQTTIDSFNSTSFYVNSFQTKILESTNGLNYTVYIKSNSLGGVKNFIIGSDILGGGRWLNGSVNEIIMYSNDLTSDRNNFVGNINTYYNWLIFMNNGYVKTWYDQSGLGRHATQVTNANQPMIFSNNSLLTSDFKSIMKYDGSNDFLVIPTFSDRVQTIFALFKKDITNFSNYDGIITARDSSSTIAANSNERVGFTGIPGNNNITGFENTTEVWINGRVRDVSSYKVYTSGQSLPYPTGLNLVTQFATSSSIGTKNIIIGADTLGARYLNGSVREIILYSSNESSNRDTIETGINSYYSVYPNIVKTGLVLNLDANDRTSYPSSGATWFDISGSGNNGTLTNGPSFGTASGGVISLDGVNDYIDFGNNTTLYNSYNSSFTQEFAIRLKSNATTDKTIFRVDDWSRISTQISTSQFKFIIGYNNPTDTLIYNGSFTYNQWYIITTVWSKLNTQKIYINGVLVAQRTPTISTYTGITGTSGGANIGRGHSDPYASNLNFDMSTFRHYNRALTDDEVLQNFNALKSRFGL